MDVSRQTKVFSRDRTAASLNRTHRLIGSQFNSCQRSGAPTDHEARKTTRASVLDPLKSIKVTLRRAADEAVRVC